MHNFNFSIFMFAVTKNIFKIYQRLIADKFLLNALNNFGLHFKATVSISTSVDAE